MAPITTWFFCYTLFFAQIFAQVKIMPMGDSTTAVTCWRADLVQMLNQQGLSGKFQLVGTQRSSCTGIGTNGGHEGYPAFKATTGSFGPKGKIVGIGGEWDDEKENLLTKVLAKNQPDVVIVLLGINDMTFGGSPAKVVAAFSKFVDKMRASRSGMKVIVAKIPPSKQVDTKALNDAIASWVPTKSTPASPVIVVDCYTGFSAGTDTRDGVHFNASGDKKVAACFAPEITRIVKEASEGRSASRIVAVDNLGTEIETSRL